MATKVIMPQLGESVVEGTISRWLRNVGETISEYDPLLEVSTDKVDTEVPSPASGTVLQIYIPEGETVQAGTVLCVIGAPNEEVAPESDVPEKVMSGGNGQGTQQTERNTRLSPVVARMVSEHGVDVNQINGTGKDGRVTKKDVENYLATGKPAPAPAAEPPPWEQPGTGDLFKPTSDPAQSTAATQQQPAPSPARQEPARAIPVEAIPEGSPGELVQLSNMRRLIADHMVHSKLQTAPHVTTVFEVDMSAVLGHLEANKPVFARQGVNLTLTAYFVQAMVAACQAVPVINTEWRQDGIYYHHAIHVGMAVAIDDGLIVPIIHNAGDLNLLGTARKVNDLAVRARNKQLKPDEIQGGTISITNHGVSGSLFATPIINQPQTAIFGVGLMEKRVKVIDDAIAIRPCVYTTLTFDHRIADGATADAWMLTLKKTLEGWGQN